MIYTLKKSLHVWNVGDRFSDTDPYIKLFEELDLLDELFDSDGTKKRWRANKGQRYWYVTAELGVDDTCDFYDEYDAKSFESGNYFKSRHQADIAADSFKALLAAREAHSND